MLVTTFFGMLAGAFTLLEIIPYTLSILGRDLLFRKIPDAKRTIPNLATWTILSVVGGIIAFSYYERGDLSGFWFNVGLCIEACIAAVLALWYGEHRRNATPPFSRLDKICLAGAAAGLVGWYVSGSWEIPIAINIVVDIFGIVPTIEKVWRLPWSESLRAWTMTVAGAVCALIALGPLETWNFDRAAFLVYMTLGSGSMTVLLLRRFLQR